MGAQLRALWFVTIVVVACCLVSGSYFAQAGHFHAALSRWHHGGVGRGEFHKQEVFTMLQLLNLEEYATTMFDAGLDSYAMIVEATAEDGLSVGIKPVHWRHIQAMARDRLNLKPLRQRRQRVDTSGQDMLAESGVLPTQRKVIQPIRDAHRHRAPRKDVAEVADHVLLRGGEVKAVRGGADELGLGRDVGVEAGEEEKAVSIQELSNIFARNINLGGHGRGQGAVPTPSPQPRGTPAPLAKHSSDGLIDDGIVDARGVDHVQAEGADHGVDNVGVVAVDRHDERVIDEHVEDAAEQTPAPPATRIAAYTRPLAARREETAKEVGGFLDDLDELLAGGGEKRGDEASPSASFIGHGGSEVAAVDEGEDEVAGRASSSLGKAKADPLVDVLGDFDVDVKHDAAAEEGRGGTAAPPPPAHKKATAPEPKRSLIQLKKVGPPDTGSSSSSSSAASKHAGALFPPAANAPFVLLGGEMDGLSDSMSCTFDSENARLGADVGVHDPERVVDLKEAQATGKKIVVYVRDPITRLASMMTRFPPDCFYLSSDADRRDPLQKYLELGQRERTGCEPLFNRLTKMLTNTPLDKPVGKAHFEAALQALMTTVDHVVMGEDQFESSLTLLRESVDIRTSLACRDFIMQNRPQIDETVLQKLLKDSYWDDQLFLLASKLIDGKLRMLEKAKGKRKAPKCLVQGKQDKMCWDTSAEKRELVPVTTLQGKLMHKCPGGEKSCKQAKNEIPAKYVLCVSRLCTHHDQN